MLRIRYGLETLISCQYDLAILQQLGDARTPVRDTAGRMDMLERKKGASMIRKMFALCAITALTVFSVATVQAARPASTVVVTPEDLAVPPDAFTVQESWYFYNDSTNTASTDESASQQFTFGPE